MQKMVAAVLLCMTGTALADVADSSPQGFTLRYRVEVAAPPATVWASLTDVARWWEPQHTYSNDARNLSLEPLAGGCFCERLGLYGRIEHMRVLYAEPVKQLRLDGALGPLQELAVTGRMTWNLTPADKGTVLTMTYAVGGYAPRPLNEWAAMVDEVIGIQVERLARVIATGAPEKPSPDNRK